MFPNARNSYPGGSYDTYRTSSQLAAASRNHHFFLPRAQPRIEDVTTSNNSSNRKRISVACGRCRKRKIRCSGDPGDGSGCQNCKTAGLAKGQCQFLRVQCQQLQLNELQNNSIQSENPYEGSYGTNIAYPAAACLTAPPVMIGENWAAQMQNHMMYHPNLQTSRSMGALPNFHGRRSPPQQSQIQPDDNLQLLARNAEEVSNVAVNNNNQMNIGEKFSESISSTNLDALVSASSSSYAVPHWEASTTAEEIRGTNAGETTARNTSSDESKAFVSVAYPEQYYDESSFAPTISASNVYHSMNFLPTSNVRDGNFSPESYGCISTGVGALNLAFPHGQRDRMVLPPPPPPPPSSLTSGEKTEGFVASSGDYSVGFSDGLSNAPIAPQYSQFARMGAALGFFQNAFLDKNQIKAGIRTPTITAPTSNNSVKVPTSRSGSYTASLTSSGHSRGSSSGQYSDKSDNVSPRGAQIPKMKPGQLVLTSTPRPSSSGCGSSVNGSSNILRSHNAGRSAIK